MGRSADPHVTIVITSLNASLLWLCRSFLPPDVPVFVIDGRRDCWGLRSIEYMIEHVPARWAVLLDEDGFVIDFGRVRQLVDHAVQHDIACIGMPDGGIVPIRRHNPNAMNMFFNILDLEQIRAKWNSAACQAHIGSGSAMRELWPPPERLTPGAAYRFDDFEPYYCFYFWLKAAGFRLEWLTGRSHTDGLSTILTDASGEPFLLHTWYGRNFVSQPCHRERILQAARFVTGGTPADVDED
jgi:hypothetical protein